MEVVTYALTFIAGVLAGVLGFLIYASIKFRPLG